MPLPPAALKSIPEDFRVEEQLSFEPSGDGPHWLLRVEKRAANTRWVAARIAQLAGVAAHDVGYAGLKDRQAVTVQWFSVPVLGHGREFWSEVHTTEFKVLEVRGNTRKLKRGALRGNRFRIRLRQVAWSREQLEIKVCALREYGVPNYFGLQRFGRDASNLERVAQWVHGGEAPRGRAERSFALSAARSLLFNAVLARRVAAGDWSQLAPGDLASLDGSGSHFAVTDFDAALLERLRSFDIHPSGPLWGRGGLPTSGRALEHETAIAEEFRDVVACLAEAGLEQERRARRAVVRDLNVEADGNDVLVTFELGRGQFATSVLREMCEFGETAELDADEA